jgi:UDP-glucuronate decarboxylase
VSCTDLERRRPDIARAQALLGSSPRVPLAEGPPRTIDDLRRRLARDARRNVAE